MKKAADQSPREWRPAYGFEDTHEVSNYGEVRSWIKGTRWGRRRLESPRLLSCYKHKDGYMHVTLIGKTKKVHRLVLESFVGPAPTGKECAHNNGIATDNRVENLRWATRSENIRDQKIHGTVKQSGERNNNAKLTAEQVESIRNDDRRTYVVAHEHGVSWQTIDDIRKGRKWKSA